MSYSDAVKKAYAIYDKIKVKDFLHVTTTELNIAYNVLMRMRREEGFREAIYAERKEDEGLDVLLEKYFAGYNNLHGLDITETLTVFDDPDLSVGTYFLVSTEKDGEEVSPIGLKSGESVHVTASLISRLSEKPVIAKRLRYVATTDKGESYEQEVLESDKVEFDLTLDRPGGIRFKVFYENELGRPVIGSETAYGGVLFDIEKIKPTHKAPEDLVPFWQGEIDRLMAVIPTDDTAEGYEGRVSYEYDIPKKNRFSLTSCDGEYLSELRDAGINGGGEERLSDYELYEVYLKAPGPCPSTAYITVPRDCEPHSLPIHIVFDGYSAHTPAPIYSKEAISIHCTHHGYELKKPDKDYYNHLNGAGILGSYGRGNGKPNSDYKDIHDCYLLYMLLRNLQMIRFATDPETARVIPSMLEAYNGRVRVSGGSMGGYQTTCIGGLLELMKVKHPFYEVLDLMPNIPAFCNVAGPLEGRAPTGLHTYEEGVDYFDAAILASLIRADMRIPRVGLGDETCPHTGISAMVNNIPEGVGVTVNYLQNSSHGYVMDPELQKWFVYKK